MQFSRTLRYFLFLLALCALAQDAKRPLAWKDADSWRSIQSQTLSRDGHWLAYGLFPQEGDGEVVVRDLRSGKELRENAGTLPPPPEPDPTELNPQGPQTVRIRVAFTADGRFLLSSVYPRKADTDQARKEKKKPEEMPKNGLLIFDLSAGRATRVDDVRSFQVPERGPAVAAWLKESREAAPRGRARPEFGSELVFRDLTQSQVRTFADVLEYTLTKDGATLVYAVATKKSESNGVFALPTRGDAQPAALLAGKGRYSKLTWDLKQARLAFLSDRDDAGAKPPKSRLYLWERGAAAAGEIVSPASDGFRPGWVFSERATFSFSRDGARLFAGCAPARPPEREPAADSTPAEEKVLADLWHWRDPFIQPMQRVRATLERNRSYSAVYHLASKKFLQLADETMPQLTPSDDGRFAIGADDRAYRSQVDFDGNYADYYLVDTESGRRTKFTERSPGGGRGSSMAWSPDSRSAVFYRDRAWHSVSAPDGAVRNLTAALKVSFFNEEHDTPDAPSSYGSGGWTRDGKYALLYDRYDIWRVSPSGAAAESLTLGTGRARQIRFRIQRLEPDEEDEPRGFDSARPVVLRGESLDNYDSGFWRARLDTPRAPEKLVMGSRDYAFQSKAREADTLLFTATRYDQPPDLWLTDSSFAGPRKVTEANPQRSRLLWGTSELLRFKNADGVGLKAALFKPENFDPGKKYPLMVYIYERLSQGLHAFSEPRPGTSINKTIYVSNGYLVLMPDIVYTVGSPGESALKCVLPAIQALVERGYVDEKAIGIQGHSWGGYQIAYMLGRTSRFRAAEAGAPVGNMTSAYNGIRWGSGLPRQFQYEKTQSRIGDTLWDRPLYFIENSPVFRADRVTTPVLILHNDQDDAVPWQQGIELYLSLRRNGKEAYLFNYNGEKHGIRKRINQKDYSLRMMQFFDHFLKGAPPPAWMQQGIPYLEREEEKEKFKAAANGS